MKISPVISACHELNKCFEIPLGFQIKDTFKAKVGCAGVTIKEMQITGPQGLFATQLAQLSTDTWYVNITWTPTSTQLGLSQICAFATDSTYLIDYQCFSVKVVAATLYEPLLALSNYPKDTIDLNLQVFDPFYKNNAITFVLTFNKFGLTSPSPLSCSTYIRIFSQLDNSQVYAIDTTTMVSNGNFNMIDNFLIFKVPFSAIQQNVWHYILVDYGAVIINNKCIISSDQISDPLFWPFKVISKKPTTIALTKNTATTTKTTKTRKHRTTTQKYDTNACNLASFLTILISFIIGFIVINCAVMIKALRSIQRDR